MAVKRDKREKDVATILGSEYLERAKQQGVAQIVGRIREEKEETHLLIKRFGFSVIPEQSNPKNRIYDPLFPNNVYVLLSFGALQNRGIDAEAVIQELKRRRKTSTPINTSIQ